MRRILLDGETAFQGLFFDLIFWLDSGIMLPEPAERGFCINYFF